MGVARSAVQLASKKAALAAPEVARTGPRFPQPRHSTRHPPPGLRTTFRGVWGGQRCIVGRGAPGYLLIETEPFRCFTHASSYSLILMHTRKRGFVT